MIRLLAALAAALLLAPAALAQEQTESPEKKPAAPTPEVDAKTAEAIRKAVEKAKEEIRDEVRAELQGAQSAAEFLGASAEGPKLEFLELDGYLRTRGQLFDQLGLGAGIDPQGEAVYFPDVMFSPGQRSTMASTNMRLRLEPTLNVSENVRVKAQFDVLDNYVLGSSQRFVSLDDEGFNPYPVPFYGSSRVVYQYDPRQDRPAITPKRAWAEIQTPVGLLSFGRMPSGFGLGILTNAGPGLDDDFGDTVDRIQFALPPVATPVGSLTFIPILDFDGEGALYPDQQWGTGVGQPFDVDSADDARTYALKAVRIDTPDEIRRKLDRGSASFNFGAYYNYRTQRNVFPEWLERGYGATLEPGRELWAGRKAYGHVFDLWLQFLLPRWRFEVEGTYVYGIVGNTWVVGTDGAATNPSPVIKSMGQALLRQWGAVFQGEFQAIPNKVSLGLELGFASGDDAPGFGNVPTRGVSYTIDPATGDPIFDYQDHGSAEGPQFGLFPKLEGNGTRVDRDIRNFRFNPAYRVDLVLWRTILGQVTDAFYLKPSLHWAVFPGFSFDASVIYSQAMKSLSTPSSEQAGSDPELVIIVDQGNKPLGLELDLQLSYQGGDGFGAWFAWGVLQPLDGLGTSLSRGNVLNLGLSARF